MDHCVGILEIQRIAISINQPINEVLTFVFAFLRRSEVGVIEGQSIRGSAGGEWLAALKPNIIADHW